MVKSTLGSTKTPKKSQNIVTLMFVLIDFTEKIQTDVDSLSEIWKLNLTFTWVGSTPDHE